MSTLDCCVFRGRRAGSCSSVHDKDASSSNVAYFSLGRSDDLSLTSAWHGRALLISCFVRSKAISTFSGVGALVVKEGVSM